jgi:hypothetical protein
MNNRTHARRVHALQSPARLISVVRSINSKPTHADALVANAEDGLSIGDDDEVDVAPARLLEVVGLHRVRVREAEVEALGAAEEVRVVRDRVRLGRGVDDRHELLEVAADEGVVEHPALRARASARARRPSRRATAPGRGGTGGRCSC